MWCLLNVTEDANRMKTCFGVRCGPCLAAARSSSHSVYFILWVSASLQFVVRFSSNMKPPGGNWRQTFLEAARWHDTVFTPPGAHFTRVLRTKIGLGERAPQPVCCDLTHRSPPRVLPASACPPDALAVYFPSESGCKQFEDAEGENIWV